MKALYCVTITIVFFSSGCKEMRLRSEDRILGTWRFSEASYSILFDKTDVSDKHRGKTFTFYDDNTFEIDSLGYISTGTWVFNYDYDASTETTDTELILAFSHGKTYNNPWVWNYVAIYKEKMNFSYLEGLRQISVKTIR
ncbi:MAG: hypothetical protein ACLGGV_09475 [Bacteroidia bacterium]